MKTLTSLKVCTISWLCYGINTLQHDVFCNAHFQYSDTGFPVWYRFDGNIFNLRMLQAKTKVQTDVLDEILYADDIRMPAQTEATIQRAMDQVSQSCDNYALTISTIKTEVEHRPAPGKKRSMNQPSL